MVLELYSITYEYICLYNNFLLEMTSRLISQLSIDAKLPFFGELEVRLEFQRLLVHCESILQLVAEFI